jgi:hypothetical protein
MATPTGMTAAARQAATGFALRAQPSASCRALKDLHHFLGHQLSPHKRSSRRLRASPRPTGSGGNSTNRYCHRRQVNLLLRHAPSVTAYATADGRVGAKAVGGSTPSRFRSFRPRPRPWCVAWCRCSRTPAGSEKTGRRRQLRPVCRPAPLEWPEYVRLPPPPP